MAPQPRRVVSSISNGAASAQLPVIRQVQSPHPRRVLSPDGGRRLSVCTVPSRIHSPLRRASPLSPVSSLYSTDYVRIPSVVSSDGIIEDLDSCDESAGTRATSRLKEIQIRDAELRQLRDQLVNLNSKVQETEARNVLLRSLICPLAVPPDPRLSAVEEERDIRARLLFRDALSTISTDRILSCPNELVMTLLKLMQGVCVISLNFNLYVILIFGPRLWITIGKILTWISLLTGSISVG